MYQGVLTSQNPEIAEKHKELIGLVTDDMRTQLKLDAEVTESLLEIRGQIDMIQNLIL